MSENFYIKKRVIIAIVITIAVVIFTNQYWLIFKPMSVDFDILGAGRYEIEVQLNKKDNNKFDKIKKDFIDINLEEANHASFNVQKSRFPKRIKIIISNIQNNNPIKISNITFRHGKFNIDDLSQFKTDFGKLKIKENSLIIYPQNNSIISLEYIKSLNVQTAIKFDFKIFVIILILTFLFTYKLSNYVADFKTIQGKSRIEITFLTVFFVFLFVPMSHINQEEISKDENRTLAQLQPLFNEDKELNIEFGKQFNEWFNDRFCLRQFFLDTYNLKLLLSRNFITKNVVKGTDNWLFLGWKVSIDSYTNNTLFTDDELARIDNYLNSVNRYCITHNKSFYFFIAPDKSKIYPEYYPKSIKKVSDTSKTTQLIDYIRKNSKVKVIYPKDRLISKKNNNLLYWKDDTHWNLLGAYYGYSELINFIKKDYPKLQKYKVQEYTIEKHTGDLYKMTPVILRKIDNTDYTIPKVDDSKLCKYSKKEQDDVKCYNAKSSINLLMYRDSFSTSLIPYLAHSFSKSVFIWKRDVNAKAIQNADIIILEIVERNLPHLVNKHLEVQ